MSRLFTAIRLRSIEIPNRAWASPMCQYSADGAGTPTPWHLVHLGRLALGGAGAVLTEATAVSPEGRISADDTGLWHDGHAEAWEPIVAFVAGQGAVPGIQLAHAGRKGSTTAPWTGGGHDQERGWVTVGPSPVAFGQLPVPHELDEAGMARIRDGFAAATRRAAAVGFRIAEVHAAHGYLLHQYLSPLSNRRSDRYGGDLDGRMRFPLEVVAAVRDAWPEELPLLVRVSATDWAEPGEGWELEDTIELAGRLSGLGVDLVDCSSGGTLPKAPIPVGPGYQVPFASAVRAKAGLPTGAVGMITEANQAEQILAGDDADVVLLARALLRDPEWPHRAASALGDEVPWPVQYLRARP